LIFPVISSDYAGLASRRAHPTRQRHKAKLRLGQSGAWAVARRSKLVEIVGNVRLATRMAKQSFKSAFITVGIVFIGIPLVGALLLTPSEEEIERPDALPSQLGSDLHQGAPAWAAGTGKHVQVCEVSWSSDYLLIECRQSGNPKSG